MENLISIFILIPILRFLLIAILPSGNEKDETKLSTLTSIMLGVQFIALVVFTAFWLNNGANAIYKKQFVILTLSNFELFIDFVFDKTTVVFLLIGTFITFLIMKYSQRYFHREDGFKRFYTTVLFFYIGYDFIVISGNLTTIFVGWEIAGVASFLLIAYYRNRFIPVKNAIKIFSIYRLGDVAILLAMWFGHQIWHENVSLKSFADNSLVTEHIHHAPWLSIGFALCIFLAATIKSAQFPFSPWLPRAMEGPTPSSSVFYSSLAVHLGVLFLLRTYAFWIEVAYMQELIIIIGALSFILSMFAARIQPTIKGQIAYSVIAQVGLMVIEVALGWHTLALVHFASNALLRSYQLLISPSIVAYEIKKQFFEFKPVKRVKLNPLFRNISNSIYILSLNEWYLDSFMYYLVWGPFKNIGILLQKVSINTVKWISIMLLIIIPTLSIVIVEFNEIIPKDIFMTIVLGISLLYILRIFTERKKLRYAWYKIAVFHTLIVFAMYLNGASLYNMSFYIGGITLSYLVGQYSFLKIITMEQITLHGYQGHCYENPKLEFIFLLSCLGLMGFPITSAFIGFELILNGIHPSQYIALILLLLIFLINGLAMVRIYARVFLGPHVKTYHTQARKSS